MISLLKATRHIEFLSSSLSIYSYQYLLIFAILLNGIKTVYSVDKSEYLNGTVSRLDHLMTGYDGDFNEMTDQRSLERLPKLFSFYTDEDDIKVEFEFKVPFIDVPVKRSTEQLKDYTKGLVNINLPALLLSGLIIIGGIGVGKLFQSVHYINPISSLYQYYGKEQRSDSTEKLNFNINSVPFKLNYKNLKGQSSEIGLIDLFEDIENMFQVKNIDVISCVQKFICTKIQPIYESLKVDNGTTSTYKIVDGLLSSKLLLDYIKDTAIMEAINIAKNGYDCKKKFQNCKWSLTNFDNIFDSLIKI